jgi:acyl carrier protein
MTESKTLPTPAEFERQLARFIDALTGGDSPVGRDTRLFEDGYMNSMRILDLIAVVEKTLGRRVPDRAVRLANFRSIATIVQAFHPDAPRAGAPPAAPDTLFTRRGDRARFASPIVLLERRGDLAVTGAGRVALAGLALDVLEAVDDTIVSWARALGAPEHRYPSLIDLRVLDRAGQLESFPQHLTRVLASPDDTGLRPPDDSGVTAPHDTGRVALAPAVCYHAYPGWTGKTLGPEPTLLTARGHCYRAEAGDYAPLERLWEFTMREVVVLGTRVQVEGVRQSLVRQVTSLVETLELDGSIDTATDPFFAAGDEGRRLMQQAGALKHELRLTIDAAGRAIAAASFNHHHDFFGTRFAIRLAADAPAHSGCVAFGLERWVLAILAQHGVDHRSWPHGARSWLDEWRDRRRGARG